MITETCNIIGLDQSLSHTAAQHVHQIFYKPGCHENEVQVTTTPWALITDVKPAVGTKAAKKPKKLKAGATEVLEHALHRLSFITDAWESYLSQCEAWCDGQPGHVYMEGYAMGASFQREALGELGGQLKRVAWSRGWGVHIVAPMTLKKYVLGTGKGDKNLMMMETYARWGYKPSDDNDSDAYGLARLGVAHRAPVAMPCSKITSECCAAMTHFAPRGTWA